MEKETLKKKILEEMIIEDEESYKLAREIFDENFSRLKEGITIWTIYRRIVALKEANK